MDQPNLVDNTGVGNDHRERGGRCDMRYELSWWQFAVMLICSKLTLLTTYAVIIVGQLPPVRDSWLAALIASAIGLPMIFAVYALSVRFPGKTIFEINPLVLGRFLGTVANIILVAFYVHWAGITIRQFSYFLDSAVYLRTPEIVFGVLFIIIALVATREGIEFIGRTAEIAGIVILVAMSFYYLLSIPDIDFGIIRPFLGEGWERVLRQSLTPIALYGEGVWIALLAIPHLSQLKDAPKAIWIGTGVNTALGVIGAFLLLGLFGPELISRLAFPSFSATRVVSLGSFFERIEWLMLVMWVGAMGVKISLLVFGATLGTSYVFRKYSVRHLALVIVPLILITSRLTNQTLTDVLDFFAPTIYLAHALPFQLAPALILMIAWIRRLKGSGLKYES